MDPNVSASDEPSAPDDGNEPFVNEGPTPGVVIPDHRLLRCIGRGSYGSVWLAQNMMGMYRAVKIVHRQSFEHHRPFERELSGILKFEPISRSHEGFVDVLHVGIRDKDFLYYVMELGDDEVTGQNIVPKSYSPKTLSREISSSGRLTFERCLRLGLALSEALGELHKHGLVHRDIKPSNILYLNGIPKLADIGLVASTSEARSYVGTEGFIPPEGPGTPAGDVFSLGKVLYEASTGKDRHEFPELPTLLYEIPEREKFLELNEIILRACHSDPRQRYQSAAEMHSDLVVLSNGESVKRLRFLEKRFASLKKVASVGVLVLAMISVVLFLVYNAYVRSRRQQVDAYLKLGDQRLERGDFFGALPHFADAAGIETGESRLADTRLRIATTLAQSPRLIQMWSHPRPMDGVEFNSRGDQVIVHGERPDGVQIFDVKTGAAVSPLFAKEEGTSAAALSPDGNWVATRGDTNQVIIWKRDGTKFLTLDHPDNTVRMSFSPDGKELVTTCDDNCARVWDVQTGELRLRLAAPQHGNVLFHSMTCARFSHNGKLIATGSRDCTARIWDAQTGRQLAVFEHSKLVSSIAFSPDDRVLASGCFDHKLHFWKVASGEEILPALMHDDGIPGVEFSPDGQFVVSADAEGTARLWSAADHQPYEVNPIFKHGDRVRGVAFSPNGHQIASACQDGGVRIWELAGGEAEALPGFLGLSGNAERFASVDENKIQICATDSKVPISPKIDLGFAPSVLLLNYDGKFVLAASRIENTDTPQQEIVVLQTATGVQAGPSFKIPECRKLELSRDGKRVLAMYQNSVQTWSVDSGKALSPEIVRREQASATFSPDASRIAVWNGTTFELLDAVSAKPVQREIKFDDLVYAVVFSADGSRMVICCSDSMWHKCSAYIWNAETGTQIGEALQHRDGVLCAAFSPDGSRIITGSEDFSAIIWDAQTGRQLTPPMPHAHQVWGVAFSPDGRWVATASTDNTARLWSAENGDPLSPPFRHSRPLASVRFLPNGQHIVTEGGGDAWLWSISAENQSVEKLKDLAGLLCGSTGGWSESKKVQPESFRSRWLELRKSNPEQFTVSSNQIAAWDEYHARKSEANLDWSSAEFHLKRLLARRPNDESLVSRIEHVREKLRVTSVANRK